MPDHRLPRIAIATGDPAGIGPEISLKAALDPRLNAVCRPVLVADPSVLAAHARACGIAAEFRMLDSLADESPGSTSTGALDVIASDGVGGRGLKFGAVDAAHGRAALAAAERAIAAALAGQVHAVVAAPQ